MLLSFLLWVSGFFFENLGKGTELFLRDTLILTFGANNWRASINPSKSVGLRGRTLDLGSALFLPGCTACDLGNSSPVSTVVFFKGQCDCFAPLLKTFWWFPSAYRLNSIRPHLLQVPECFSQPSSCLPPLLSPTSRHILQCTPCFLFASIMHIPCPVFLWTCHAALVPSPGICSSQFGRLPLEYAWWSPTYPSGPIHLFLSEAAQTPSLPTHTWYGGHCLLCPTMGPCHCSSQHTVVHLFINMFVSLL